MTALAPDLTRIAKAVITRLVEAEPRPANHGPGWLVAVERRIRSERWPDICDLVAQHPYLPVDELVAMASPPPASPPEGGVIQQQTSTPSAAITEWSGPKYADTDGPVIEDRSAIRSRLDAARDALHATTKPPMGPAPISTRGRVA